MSMYLHESAELVAMLLINEGIDPDELAKASGVWVVSLEAPEDGPWKLWVNGEPIGVNSALIRNRLRERTRAK